MALRYGWKLDRPNSRLEVQVAGQTVAYFPGRGSEYTPHGKAFYVDMVNGSADYNGLSPETPKATIATALALCTADNDDYIYVISKGEGTYVEGATVALSKARVHIIGVSNGPHAYGQLKSATDFDVFTVTGRYSEIANFRIAGGSNCGGALITNATGTYIHHCEFGNKDAATTPKYGIWGLHQINTYCTFEDNLFMGSGGGASAGTISDTGIYMGDSAFRGSIIRNSVFINLPTSAIYGSGWDGASVMGNCISCDADTAGAGISLTNCQAVMVANNSANYGKGAMSANPFVDNGTTDCWGINYKATTATLPS